MRRVREENRDNNIICIKINKLQGIEKKQL